MKQNLDYLFGLKWSFLVKVNLMDDHKPHESGPVHAGCFRRGFPVHHTCAGGSLSLGARRYRIEQIGSSRYLSDLVPLLSVQFPACKTRRHHCGHPFSLSWETSTVHGFDLNKTRYKFKIGTRSELDSEKTGTVVHRKLHSATIL